jgi:hypothetical protein
MGKKPICMKEEEIWKDIVKYEGYYQASNLGRIKSVKRYVHRGFMNDLKTVPEKIRQASLDKHGYLTIRLHINGTRKNYFIHRLIAETFLENIEKKPQVNHIDGDRKNCHLSNLEWVTQSENIKHSFKFMGRIASGGAIAYKPIIQKDMDGNVLNSYKSITDAIKKTKINNISACLKGKYLHAGNYKWEYLK